MKIVAFLFSWFGLTFVQAQNKEACQSIVDIAVGNKDFETLVTALQAADLVKTLSGDGPFTVFAPTDNAFAKLDVDTLASLLLPENKDDLTSILLYHVVSGKVLSTDLKDRTRVETLQGGNVVVRTKPSVKINTSKVITADIVGCNGVIHVIDKVLMPDPRPYINKVGQCNADNLCGLCDGDCDKNDDCKGDYVCFKRRSYSYRNVPGCRGGSQDRSGTDYCIDPNHK
jgi:uncharacterized surface protein with fasciclin (FAS1) repeats